MASFTGNRGDTRISIEDIVMRVRSMDLGFIFRQKIREIDVTQSFPAQNWFEQVKN